MERSRRMAATECKSNNTALADIAFLCGKAMIAVPMLYCLTRYNSSVDDRSILQYPECDYWLKRFSEGGVRSQSEADANVCMFDKGMTHQQNEEDLLLIGIAPGIQNGLRNCSLAAARVR